MCCCVLQCINTNVTISITYTVFDGGSTPAWDLTPSSLYSFITWHTCTWHTWWYTYMIWYDTGDDAMAHVIHLYYAVIQMTCMSHIHEMTWHSYTWEWYYWHLLLWCAVLCCAVVWCQSADGPGACGAHGGGSASFQHVDWWVLIWLHTISYNTCWNELCMCMKDMNGHFSTRCVMLTVLFAYVFTCMILGYCVAPYNIHIYRCSLLITDIYTIVAFACAMQAVGGHWCDWRVGNYPGFEQQTNTR